MAFATKAATTKTNAKRRVVRASEALDHAMAQVFELWQEQSGTGDRGRGDDYDRLKQAHELVERVHLNMQERGW